jgi:hypothetical protein
MITCITLFIILSIPFVNIIHRELQVQKHLKKYKTYNIGQPPNDLRKKCKRW